MCFIRFSHDESLKQNGGTSAAQNTKPMRTIPKMRTTLRDEPGDIHGKNRSVTQKGSAKIV